MSQRVLVIDDAADVQALLAQRLKPDGLRLHFASSASEGLEVARSVRPDLVLLDIDLGDRGGLSGVEVCKVLKADPVLSHIPIIFITVTNDVELKVQCFELGAADFVTKPFEPAELRARVRAALRTKRLVDLLASKCQIDGLTGLFTRAHFDTKLEDELSASRRYGRHVSLLWVHVDHLRQLNEQYGHPFGDRVLERIAKLLGATRATDVACRVGGNEFALILTETPRAGAITLAEALRARIAELVFVQKGTMVAITATFAVASSHDLSERTPARMLGALTTALAEGKRDGRNCVRAWSAPSSPPGSRARSLGPTSRAGDPT